MRFLFLNHNVRGSGTYRRAFYLARELVVRGHSVTVMTTSASARMSVCTEVVDDVRIVEAPDLLWGRGRTGWDAWNTIQRMRWLRPQQFDLLHAFDSRPAVVYPALAVRRWTGAPLFMDWADWWGRGGWIQDRSSWPVRTLLGPIETWHEEHFRTSASGTTAVSNALAQRAIGLGVRPDTVLCLPQGCDVSGIVPRSAALARQRLGLECSLPVVLHVGLLTAGDHTFLLEAFHTVRRQIGDALLVLAGRTAIRVASSPGIVVTGELGETTLLDWIAAADVCVVPFRDTVGNRGRWPSSVNDYLACGRPVVIPRVGDAGELIRETGAGCCTEPTSAAFAAGMLRLLRQKETRRELSVRARAVAEARLAWPVLTERLLRFYDTIRKRTPYDQTASARLPAGPGLRRS